MFLSVFLPIIDDLSWSEPGANNTQVMGSIPIWAIHSRPGLEVLLGPFQLRLMSFCGCFPKSPNDSQREEIRPCHTEMAEQCAS